MINSPTAETNYTTQTGVLSYAIGFEYFLNTDNSPQLEVMLDGDLLVYLTDYTLSEDGLSIVFPHQPTINLDLDIRRDVPFTQESEYQVGRIDPTQIEDDIDTDVMRAQQILNKLKYVLQLSDNQKNIFLQKLLDTNDQSILYFDYATETIMATEFPKDDVVLATNGMLLDHDVDTFGNYIFKYSIDGGTTWHDLYNQSDIVHNDLSGRSVASAHPASAIDFDNGDSTLTPVQTKLATVIATTATNTANIATNTGNISTNTGNIATNTADIAANTADIATNTADIATNTAAIATNTGNISTNTTAISNLNSSKQNVLTAGTNITIVGDTISSSPGITIATTSVAGTVLGDSTNDGNVAVSGTGVMSVNGFVVIKIYATKALALAASTANPTWLCLYTE